MSGEAGVKVFCRFRPFNKREIELGADKAVDFKFTSHSCKLEDGGRKYEFPFDYCWDGNCHQTDVYNHCAAQSVQDIFQGYNGTIFAYGQTGAGKSWSMMGDKNSEDLKGIIPRAGDDIFANIEKDASGTTFTVKCSYLEVYREAIKDLLNPQQTNMPVREHPTRGIYVDGLTEVQASSSEEVMDVINLGDSARAVASTNMNAVSSRSHSVFIVKVQQVSEEGSKKEGKLNLVDLAGSEKVGKTGASGQTLEEAKMINKSLSALGQVIKALSDGKGHIPYRDSKLTRILQEALGGNSKTSLLVAASPHLDNLEETISTMKFAQRAKTIKNKVKLNEEKSVGELNAIIAALKKEVEGLQAYSLALEKALTEAGGDPSTVKVVKAPSGKAAGGAAGGSAGGGGGGGGGGDPVVMAQLTAEKDKLNDLLKIAQADKEEAESLVEEAKAASEAAMEEGGKAKEQMEIMAKQREQERALAMRAVGELKTMRSQMSEKDTLLMKAATRQKEMQAAVEAANQEKAEAENEKSNLQDELEQAQTKLKTMEMKMSAIAGGGAPPQSAAAEGDAPAASEDAGDSPLDAMLASIDAQAKQLEEAQKALSAEKAASREHAAKLAAAEAQVKVAEEESEEFQRQIENAKESAQEKEDLHITTLTGLELERNNLDEQVKELNDKLEQADLLTQKLQGDVRALQTTAQRQSLSGGSAALGNMSRPGVQGGASAARTASSGAYSSGAVARGSGGTVSVSDLKANFGRFRKAVLTTATGDSTGTSSAAPTASPKASSFTNKLASAMGLTAEDEMQAVPVDPRGSRLTIVKPDGTAGDSWDEGAAMVVPPGNTHTMDECKRMYRWLENMMNNLKILQTKYDEYCSKMEDAGLYATELAETVEKFATGQDGQTVISKSAKLFKDLLIENAEEQQSVFSESRDRLADVITNFWQKEDSLSLYNGSLNKMLQSSSTSYCVAVARALATSNKDKYTNDFDKSRKELGLYAAHRWDYVVACENVSARCELDVDDVFTTMLGAQSGVAETSTKLLEAMQEQRKAAEETMTQKTVAFQKAQNDQEQFRTRLGLRAADTPPPCVEWSAKTKRAEGMLFMLPVPKGKPSKGKKDVWLPVWGWVEADWGTFNYNAEWQGPVPGMKTSDRESYMLKGQLDLDKCAPKGLDGEGLPATGKGARLFTFELQYTHAGSTSVHKFQALSANDIARWKTAITGNAPDIAAVAPVGSEPEPELEDEEEDKL